MVTEGSGREPALGPVAELLAALFALILGFGAMQVTALITSLANVRLHTDPHYGLPLMLLLSETALVLPGLVLLLFLARGQALATSLGLTLPESRVLLYALGLGATLWVASIGLLGLQSLAWPPDPAYIEVFRKLLETLRPRGALDALVSVAAIAVVPALCEEMLLRGILLPPLARAMGAFGGVLTSALLFATIHWDLYRFPFTFAMGLALGVLRLRTASLTPGVLSHALLNTITFAVAPLIGETDDDVSPLVAVALLAVGATLSLLILRALRGPGEKR
jgi:membrane protease YdiL (CAAX protease family)